MALLIDTSVWIGLERRGLTLDDLAGIDPSGTAEPPVVASITASELLGGVHRAAPSPRRTRRLALVEQILASVEVIPFDLAAARIHAVISAQLDAAGTPIGQHDLLIAATALTHGHAVFTDNLREFGRVTGLTARQPTWPT